MDTVVVTGSSGLIGSEAVEYFARRAKTVIGVDNNLRRDFFGPDADTTPLRDRLLSAHANFRHFGKDIRDRDFLCRLIKDSRPDLIIHAAAQPSHDLSALRPADDFDINVVGTFNVLEAARLARDSADCDPVICFTSSSKVYGDAPNEIPVNEMTTRYDYVGNGPGWSREGILETFRIDQSLHSPFGAAKVAADIVAQEYGRYFGLKVGVFRGSCLTGSRHRGVELHGFLSHLFAVAKRGGRYTIFGYRGKQVRDNIHSLDCVRAFEEFYRDPRPGEVYNLAAGRPNSCSVLEAIQAVRNWGYPLEYDYSGEVRRGDHCVYIGDNEKLRRHYPNWDVSKSLESIYDDLAAA